MTTPRDALKKRSNLLFETLLLSKMCVSAGSGVSIVPKKAQTVSACPVPFFSSRLDVSHHEMTSFTITLFQTFVAFRLLASLVWVFTPCIGITSAQPWLFNQLLRIIIVLSFQGLLQHLQLAL